MGLLQPGLFLQSHDTSTAALVEEPLQMASHTSLNIDTLGALKLPVNAFIGQRIAVLGSSGFGKSNTIAVLFEELADELPITIFDPHGEYYGLTEKFDILHVGKGEFVDIEAGVSQAESIANFAFDNRVHVIVNMLEMTDDERLEFTYLYCKKLWDLNRRIKRPIGVFLDEAHIFIPQTLANIPALQLMIQFALEGRKFGFTVLVSDQRVATINKSVLAQCGVAFLHGVAIHSDMQAYQGMLPYSMQKTKELAYGLKRGQAIVNWIYEGERGTDIIQVRKRYTFHASDTPTSEQAAMPNLRRLDKEMIAELKAAMTPQKAVSIPTAVPAAESPAPVVNIEAAAAAAYKDTLRILEAKYESQHQRDREHFAMLIVAYGGTVRRLQTLERQNQILEAAASRVKMEVVVPLAQPALIEQGDEEEDEYRSPRSISRAISKQQGMFNALMRDLGMLPRFQQTMLVYLMRYEGQELELRQIARFIGIAPTTIYDRPPLELIRRGLIIRRTPKSGQYYKANVREMLEANYPDLDQDALFEQVSKLQKLT